MSFLDTATNAALAATTLLEERFDDIAQGGQSLTIETKKDIVDNVTEMDKLAQETIISIIQDQYPDHRFLAEEEGADSLGNPDCPYRWIIDPLDGTTNYIHGRLDWGSIVALENEGGIEVAVMHIPKRHDLFQSEKGKGAFCNKKKCAVRKTQGITDAVLCSNTQKLFNTDVPVRIFKAPLCNALHNYGAAAVEIGEIIQGRIDGCIFNGIGLWDIAGGVVMVEEAGGKVWWEWKNPDNPRDGIRAILSTNPIFKELKEFYEKQWDSKII